LEHSAKLKHDGRRRIRAQRITVQGKRAAGRKKGVRGNAAGVGKISFSTTRAVQKRLAQARQRRKRSQRTEVRQGISRVTGGVKSFLEKNG